MTAPLGDISGHPFPRGAFKGPTPGVVTVPPVRERNGAVTSELLLQTYNVLPAGGAFTALTSVSTGGAFSFTVSPLLKVRLARLSLSALDMIYFINTVIVFFRLAVDAQPLAPWNNVPLFPAAGAVKPIFDMNLVLKPGQTLTAFAANNDVATRVFAMTLYGWQYPADYVDGRG